MFSLENSKLLPAAVLSAGIGAVVLTGCGASVDQTQPATITEHHHHPAYTTVIIVNKTPIVQFHPERFELDLEQCLPEFEDKNHPDGCIKDSVDVSEETYNEFHDGDTIVLDPQS